MRSLAFLTWYIAFAAARFSLPEDPYAFPKYRVTFLNALPLVNDTAEQWLKKGLEGGILEFMEQPWQESIRSPPSSSPKEIESGEPVVISQHHNERNYSLERIKMGPKDTFLCFVPNPLEPPRLEAIDEEIELSPIRGWQLLQPLAGTCLYHRHGWFTYSYCHNQEIRQFKELAQVPSSIGGYKPEEDPNWHAYTLGKAPPTPEPGKELTVAEKNAIAANIELAKGAGSRYLVQRWGDGTLCDKTGKKREVEVQFHCSMAMSDHVLFVKETKTCSYLVVIHTPRLCSEPGFRNPYDVQEEALVRCREVVPTGSLSDPAIRERFKTLSPESAHPVKFKHRRPEAPPPPPLTPPKSGKTDIKPDVTQLQELIKKALSASGMAGKGDTKIVVEKVLDNGEVVFEVLGDEIDSGDEWDSSIQDMVSEALRGAGWGIKKEDKKQVKDTNKKKKGKDSNEGKSKSKSKPKAVDRIEL